MLALLDSAIALAPSAKAGIEHRPALRPAAALSAFTAAPAFAEVVANPYASAAATVSSDDGGDFIGDALGFLGGSILNLLCFALVAFIIKFGFDALIAASQAPAINIDEDEEDDGPRVPQNLSVQGGALFDDSGTGAVTAAAKKEQGKKNFMKGAGGREFAPWMQIDQNAIAKAKAQRDAEKRKGK